MLIVATAGCAPKFLDSRCHFFVFYIRREPLASSAAGASGRQLFSFRREPLASSAAGVSGRQLVFDYDAEDDGDDDEVHDDDEGDMHDGNGDDDGDEEDGHDDADDGFPGGFSVVLSPLSGWVLQGSLGGSPFFSVSQGGNAVEFDSFGFQYCF